MLPGLADDRGLRGRLLLRHAARRHRHQLRRAAVRAEQQADAAELQLRRQRRQRLPAAEDKSQSARGRRKIRCEWSFYRLREDLSMTLPALPGTPPRTDTEAGVLTFVRSEPTAPCPVTCGQQVSAASVQTGKG